MRAVGDSRDPYKVLQVDPEAEDEVVQAAYRRLARKYHPDLAPDAAAADRMQAINAAWELIGSPARRAAYDRARGSFSGTSAATPTSARAAASAAGGANSVAGGASRDRLGSDRPASDASSGARPMPPSGR